MNTVAISGELRSELGKKHSKAARNEGKIPCVMYGGEQNIHFTVTPNDVKNMVYSADFKLADVTVGGNTYKAILKSYTMHPVTDELTHIDFLQLIDGKPVKVDVPVRFKGSSPGVKLGGKLMQSLRRVTVKTLPEHLVDELFLDVSELELGNAVRVREIEAPDTIQIMNDGAIPVASVEVPRSLRSATAAAAKEEEEEEAE
jgi:large subunit ribosomal protein L25